MVGFGSFNKVVFPKRLLPWKKLASVAYFV